MTHFQQERTARTQQQSHIPVHETVENATSAEQKHAHAERLANFMEKMHGMPLAAEPEIARDFGLSVEEGSDQLDVTGNDYLKATTPAEAL